MWDLMYPKAYQPRSFGARSGGGGRGGRKRCAACRGLIGNPRLNGHRLALNYCEQHFCRMIMPNGQCCTLQNNGRSQYCDNHIRCHATGDDGRCWRLVKEEKPGKFEWCKEHGCAYSDCKNRRTDPANPNCALHRCNTPACDKPKQQNSGSFFCDKHTCRALACLAQVPAAGDADAAGAAPDAAAHFCDLHRPCAAAGCRRRVHVRASSALGASRFCGAHYCAVPDVACDKPRVGGGGGDDCCADHTCVEVDCRRVRAAAGGGDGGGRFCREHACSTCGCAERRDRRFEGVAEHCPLHTCAVVDCARRGNAGGGRCEVHRECEEPGCREWVYVERGRDVDVKHAMCENHLRPRCAGTTILNTPCENRLPRPPAGAGPPLRFCADHACSLRACPNVRPPTSLHFCAAHKCAAAAGCQEQVQHAALLMCLGGGAGGGGGSSSSSDRLQTRLLLLASAGSGGGGGGGGSGGGGLGAWGVLGALGGASSFCAAHSCLGDGGACGAEVVSAEGLDGRAGRRGGGGRRGNGGEQAGRFCIRHECGHRGCRAEATHQSRRRGLCDRHYRKRRDGVGAGGDMGGPFGVMGPGPMGMMPPGFAPLFGGGGGGGYESSDESSSDGSDRRGPVVMPFAAPFF